MRGTRVGRSWNRNRGEGFVLDSHAAAGRGAGGPSPLQVEAAEMARDIHDFANKEKTGDFAGFHGFAGKALVNDLTGGSFRGLEKRCPSRYADFLLDASELELQIQRQAIADPEFDAGTLQLLESQHFDRDLVRARRKIKHRIVAGLIREGACGNLRVGIGDGYLREMEARYSWLDAVGTISKNPRAIITRWKKELLTTKIIAHPPVLTENVIRREPL